MPELFPATMAEREAELLALQAAFDEYIASSRELEEELDAELAKMQEKLAESTAANRALSAQLENIAPQLNSLEAALTESRKRLREEQELRRAAEAAQDDSEQRMREMEESLQHAREECDAAHEELAFKENEIEETRLELEVEKQQLLNELAEMKARCDEAEARTAARAMAPLADDNSTAVTGDNYVASEANDAAPNDQHHHHANNGGNNVTNNNNNLRSRDSSDSVPSIDDGYVRKLEEELELVTEQLIETENRLSETEGQAQALQVELDKLASIQGTRTDDDDDLIRQLQTENADRLENEQKLVEDLAILKDELALCKEEIALTQEELQAVDEERKALELALEEEQVKHREDVTKLTIQVKEAEVESKTSLGEAALVAANIQRANSDNEQLRHQVAALEAALKLAKQDYQSVLEELEEVNVRFDEARSEAKRVGRDSAMEELRDKMKADVEHEVSTMKFQLLKLSQENAALQQKIDDTEISLAALRDSQDSRGGASASASASAAADEQVHSEVVRQLQAQLARAKEELSKKDAEMAALTNSMEDRLRSAEERAAKVESDLHAAKGLLAEAEARVSVLRLEKDRLENTTHIPQSPTRPGHKGTVSGANGLPPTPPSLARLSLADREEIMGMDEEVVARRLRTPKGERSRSSSPSSVMKLEYKLQEERKKFSELQREYELLQDQKRMGEVRIKRLEEDMRLLHKELFSHGGDTAITTQMSRLSSLATHEKDVDLITQPEVDESQRINSIIESRDVRLVSEELRSIEKKYNAQREYNAQLLSKMLHLQGNIQVYCRVRPMTISEMQRGYKEIVESLSETEVGCFDSRTNKWKSFAYDRVWGPDQSQQSVFQDVEPLALSVVDGFNACIFAYGQTGTVCCVGLIVRHVYENVSSVSLYGLTLRALQL
jgi:chromosome segregation ATPase